MTAIMLLTFHGLQNPQGDELSSDDKLVESGLKTLKTMAEEAGSEVVRSFCNACGNLHAESRRKCIENSVRAGSVDFSAYLVDI
jgi:hypothetical protein